MKAELTLPEELVKEIAEEVIKLLEPILLSNDKHKAEGKIFDKKGLSEYLKLSQSTIIL